MKGVWAVPVIFGIALILTVFVIPAMAFHADSHGVGRVVSINPAEKHGTIERVFPDASGLNVVDSGDLYQFRIPQDLGPTYIGNNFIPAVGNLVQFDIDPEKSRHATNLEPWLDCPPNCFGGV